VTGDGFVEVGDGARLVLEDAPLVVADGADVLRLVTIRLGVSAVAVVRDIVVLGRAGNAADVEARLAHLPE
jgi:urease accessory protein UreH